MMSCQTEAQLVDQFAANAANYFGAVNQLCAAIAGSEGGEASISESYWKARQEHEKCTNARHAVEAHRHKHGCQASAILVEI
jgi:hypothetical protein